MSNKFQKQIADEIKHYSEGDDRLGELLLYCIGRLCLKSAKAGELWRKELNSIDVPHIVDWLKAAIINDDAWLNNVDEKNRPKKLMKFGSFEDIQKEADKAMLRANQQNYNIKLVEGDEELYMQLEDGYHLVKLLTPAALDLEGAKMQHCIGGGAYDKYLDEGECYFLSLRDGYGKPHATLELNGNGLTQLQGKQNQAPNIKYTKALKPFFAKAKIAIYIPIRNLKYVVSSEGNAYDIGNLPNGLEVNGNLDLVGTDIRSLPKGLKVNGGVDLRGTDIRCLPEEIEIEGGLYLGGAPSYVLRNNIELRGSWRYRETLIKSLPKGIKVGGDLCLAGTSMEFLPEGLEVGGSLIIDGTSITSLPNGLKVGEYLTFSASSITSLPEGLVVGRSLDLSTAKHITSLPEGIEVGGSLDLRGSSIELLPESLKIGGNLYLNGTSIRSLPKGLEVGREVYGLPGQDKGLCVNR